MVNKNQSVNSSMPLDLNQRVDHAVEVVEEGEKVESKLKPALSGRLYQLVIVHDGGWIVEAGRGHHRAVHVSRWRLKM